MQTTLPSRYAPRAWENEEEEELDPNLFFREEYIKDMIVCLVYCVSIRILSGISTHIIERVILRCFPLDADEWVCRASGSRHHRVDNYQILWTVVGCWMPFAMRDVPFVKGRRHYYDVVPSSFAIVLLGHFIAILVLLVAAAYQYIANMMKPKLSTPMKNEIAPSDLFFLDRSIWLAKRRFLKNYASRKATPEAEPKPEPAKSQPQVQQLIPASEAPPISNPTSVEEVLQAVTAEPGFQHLSFEELRLRQQEEKIKSDRAPSVAPFAPMELSCGIRADTNWLKTRRFRDSIFSNSTQSTDSQDSFGRATPARASMIAEVSKKSASPKIPDLLTGSPRKR